MLFAASVSSVSYTHLYEGKISTRLENKDETSKNISADEQKENGVTEYRDYPSE